MHVMTVPGPRGAAPGSWLSIWEGAEGWERLSPPGRDEPDPEGWAEALRAAVAQAPPPILLVAHSLGCLVVARAGPLPGVSGAMLVAPPDAEGETARAEIARFGPGPWEPLRYPALVVASRSDPWCAYARAAALARAWGAELADAGAAGHLAEADGFGEWPRGRELLRGFRARLDPAAPAPG